MPDNFKNILIVRTDRIGDVVLTTPVIKTLRDHFPQARISILVQTQTAVLVEGNPFLNQVIREERMGEHQGFFGFWKLVSRLRREKFDLALLYHTKKRTNSLCFFAGIPRRVGYRNNKFGWMLTDGIMDTRPQGEKHESEYCLDVLRYLKIPVSQAEVFVPLHPDAERWAEDFIRSLKLAPGQRIVAVHPGASDPSKRWPESSFEEVIVHLQKRYQACVILTGGKDIQPLSRTIAAAVPGVIDLTGKIELAQLASLFKRCRLLVSNDSGPVHIAAGVGTPVLSIFTRNQPGINPERWRPLGPRSRFLAVPKGQDISFLKAGPADTAYLGQIRPEAVIQEVDALFKLC